MSTRLAVLHDDRRLGLARAERGESVLPNDVRRRAPRSPPADLEVHEPCEFTCGSTVRILPVSRYCTWFTSAAFARPSTATTSEDRDRLADEDVRLAVVGRDDVRRGQHLDVGHVWSALMKIGSCPSAR
jgi:hypothetical protein